MAVKTIMNLIKKFDGICSYFSTKTVCLIMAYTQLIFELAGANAAMWAGLINAHFVNIEKEGHWLDPIQDIGWLMTLVLVGQILIFTVILILGLHSGERHYIELYLAYSALTIIASVIYWFMSEFVFLMNPTDTLQRVIYVAINGSFLYILRMYWIKLGQKQVEMNIDEANA